MATAGKLLGLTPGAVTRNEALLVLAHVLGVRKESLIAHPERVVDAASEARFEEALERIAAGFPATYFLGRQSFWGRDFVVTPDVLIPRADTETLVESALDYANQLEAPRILDLGTGSGAIAITLALEVPGASVVATDISPAALQIAQKNANVLKADVRFLQSDWFASLAHERFDLIVSNPPYIHPEDEHLAALRFEPHMALTDGIDGLSYLSHIIAQAPKHLKACGTLLLEHGYDQGHAVRALCASGPFEAIHTIKDLGGNERVTCATIKPLEKS